MPKDHDIQINAVQGQFVGRTHVLPVRIYYEDTDFARHVYHANFVRYLERGRTEFFRASGLDQTTLATSDEPSTFVVSRIDMNFKRPARIDDTILVQTTFERFKGPRLFTRQTITRGNETLLEADTEMAVIALDGGPSRPSRQIVEALQPYLQQRA